MHHWEPEYFDEHYDEKQSILQEIAREEYIKKQQSLEIERKNYGRYEEDRYDRVA